MKQNLDFKNYGVRTKAKCEQQAEIDKLTAEFIKSGGKIQKIKTGYIECEKRGYNSFL